MGAFKSLGSSFSSILSDQWEDYISCEQGELSSENLIVKKSTRSGQISAKSRIQIKESQAALIVDNGKIIDICVEPGNYSFDASSGPSIFNEFSMSNFGKVVKEFGDRFIYNGVLSNKQDVYFVNIQKEIQGNNFGSSTAIAYDDPMYKTIYIRFHGSYTFAITNPLLFYHNVANDINNGVYTKSQLMSQIDSEFTGAISTAIANCAYDGTPEECTFRRLTSKQQKIAQHMNDALDEEWIKNRGIEVISVGLKSVTPDESSREQISKYDDVYMMSDPTKLAARQGAAMANAMEKAAENSNGAATGFMGVGMMNMATGGSIMNGPSPLEYLNQQQNNGMQYSMNNNMPNIANINTNNTMANNTTMPAVNQVPKFCTNCGQQVTGKFCSNCGTPAPIDQPKVCPNCGATPIAGANFCVECGTKLN